MPTTKKVNRLYKDSLFTKLFSDEKNLIALYNAVGRQTYPDDASIEINTLNDVLYLDRINDISFIIDDKLVVLIEQQASINRNMPLRFLLYISKIYEKVIASDELNIYKRNLIKIPRPEFICLYNGRDDFPDEMLMTLSDAYKDTNIHAHEQTYLDLSVRVININNGRNTAILKESKTLSDYIIFTGRVRSNIESNISLSEAIDEAVKYCIGHNILADFLEQYRGEVMSMLATEFDMEKAIKAWRHDGYEEGIEEGIERGIERGLERGLEKGLIEGTEETKRLILRKMLKMNYPESDIMAIMGLSIDKLASLKAQMNN